MPSCVIPTCQNATGFSKKKEGISFHRFPFDELRKEMWTKIIRKARLDDSWNPSNVSVVCSEHFNKEDIYFTEKGLKRLRIGAVPSNNMVCGSKSRKSPTNARPHMETEIIPTESTTSSILDYDNETNIKSISDVPKISQLKHDLRRLTEYCEKYKRKIKTLQKRNRLLVFENQVYEKRLDNLKDTRGENNGGELRTLFAQKHISEKKISDITKTC